METVSGAINALFAELIEGLEGDPGLDVAVFLARHPAHADLLRSRLEKLRRAGFLGTGPNAGQVLHAMRARFGVASTIRVAGPAPADAARPDELLPSRVVGGRYRILAEIGRGGMGRVFRALDVDLGREVALKVIDLETAAGPNTPQRRAYVERFLAEAQVTSQLEHPAIVPLHDIGLDRTGQLYYTMKLVEGRTLEELITAWHAGLARGEAFPLAELVRIVLTITDALALAHERGVIHRDLKPSNVMVGRFGEVHVMDWGLAKLLGTHEHGAAPGSPTRARTGSPTLAGEVLGTPSHMAPEQARGDPAAIDQRADVYGVGAILHHVLHGEPPNQGDEHPAKPGARWIPRELCAVCRRALERDPERRYPSMAELAADLRAFLDARPGSAWRDGFLRRLTKRVRRHPGAATAIGMIVVGVFLALALTQQVVRAKERARVELEQRIATELPRVRDLGARYAANSEALDYAGWSQAWLAKLRELGIDLTREDAPTLRVRLGQLAARNPPAERALRRALYELGNTLIRAGALYAEMESIGEAIPPNPRLSPTAWAAALQRYRGLPSTAPELITLWPHFAECLEASEDDPWRREVWAASLVWWARREDRTADLFERGRERDPDDLVWLATLVLSVSGAEKSLPILEHAAWHGRASFWAQFDLGRIYDAQSSDPDHVRKAIEHTFAATALDPGSAWAHNNLGKLLFDRAAEYNARVAQAESKERERLEHERDENRRLGIESYERALSIQPDLASTHSNLANALSDPALREQHYRAALAAEPCSFGALASYANFLREKGRSDEELELRKRICQCKPESSEQWQDLAHTHHERANAFFARGEPEGARDELEGAEAAYREALRLEPNTFYLEQNLALALLQLERFDEGLELLEQSVHGREEDLSSSRLRLDRSQHQKRLKELFTREGFQAAADSARGTDLGPRFTAVFELARRLAGLPASKE